MIQYRSVIPQGHASKRLIEFETIEQALLQACEDLRTGAARPVGIHDDDGTLLHDADSIQDRCIELVEEQ